MQTILKMKLLQNISSSSNKIHKNKTIEGSKGNTPSWPYYHIPQLDANIYWNSLYFHAISRKNASA